MAANPALLTDQQSVNVIMDSITNELQGLAWLFCNQLVPNVEILVADYTNPTFSEVQNQVGILKSILCGFTAKESAIASIIKASAKKTAVDMNQDPNDVCKCLNCCCHEDK